MFAVIFEVQPTAETKETYLGLAKFLKPELEQIEGFIDNERFASQKTEGRVLSLSAWRDEKAVIRWRTLGVHHAVQETGRLGVFVDYHLRVGEITADTQVPEGQSIRQERFDTTAVGSAQVVTIAEVPPGATAPSPAAYDGADGLVDLERYEGITVPGKMLLLASWRDEAALAAWQESQSHATPAASDPPARFRAVRIIRDYGMRDRREAPQYYPPVEPAASSARE
ncbi:MAG: antibiotic biosynthesis monooxygenase family protein [Thermomicrobiales bacterium]